MNNEIVSLTDEYIWDPEPLDPELAAALCTGMMGPMIGHPLVHQPLYSPELNRMFNQSLRAKKEYVREALAGGDWSKYIWLHEKPYRLQAIWNIHQYLTPEEYWPLVAEVWMNVENHWQYKALLPRLFKAKPRRYQLIMTDEERTILEGHQDNILTIYRGHQRKNSRGWSWTFSPSRAEWFAKRFSQDGKWTIAEAQIDRRLVIAFFNRRGENEIVVNPRTREFLDMTKARVLLSPEQLVQLTRVSTGISLDVRPSRE